MPTFNVLYTVDGTDSMTVQAESPEEAREQVIARVQADMQMFGLSVSTLDVIEEED